ncbi:MAG TPA: tRNA (guanosine(37)-N1)-methyltransferase TrmD [Chloroflexia bacterium]|nr:tRNA (guanosine(37)-N1)-methyltransferase TrmD [Chloroflexia bacterium]
MLFDILSLFPEMFPGVLGASIFKRAAEAGHISARLHNIRHYTTDKHHTADDYPYGGGAGMVMKPDPLFRAVEWVHGLADAPPGISMYEPPPEALTSTLNIVPAASVVPIILMTPQGRVFNHSIAQELARHERLIILCGHYEGIDERVREHLVTDEISIGDYVLTGGELAAMVVADAVARLVPGVLAEGSAEDESHAGGLLEYPQYTRPPEFRGWRVPPVLLSGHHAQVAAWRRREALRRTLLRRPELLEHVELSKKEIAWLQEIRMEEEQAAESPSYSSEDGLS